MNIYFTLIILGIVQGIAEFLPISSSGHLVILEQMEFFNRNLREYGPDMNLFINVALHLATLVAIIIYLRHDITNLARGLFQGIMQKRMQSPEIRTIIFIAAASIPAALAGILFNDFFERTFSSASMAFIMLIINGFVLISTKKIPLKNRQLEETGLIKSFIIGVFQAVAILPGISRSGMTIAGGMACGLEGVQAARFSFLMAIPVIAGAGIMEGLSITAGGFNSGFLLPLVLAMCITVAVALLSLKLLFAIVRRIKLDLFGYYTIIVGITGLVLTGILS